MEIDMFYADAEPLFDAYYTAYQKRMNQAAWYQGFYNLQAVQSALNNVVPVSIAHGLGLAKTPFKPIEYPSTPLEMDDRQHYEQEITPQTEDTLVDLEMRMMSVFK